MMELVTADEPDLLCLQEVPPAALGAIGSWTGMTVVGDVARPPSLGPVPLTVEAGELLTRPWPGRLRSFFAGQANAVLLGPRLRLLGRSALTVNDAHFRRVQSRWLRLPAVARLAWAREPRVCQAVRVALPDGRAAMIGNLHATVYPPDKRLADAEVLRAAVFLDALAEPDDVCILAGDLNVKPDASWNLTQLTRPAWGFEGTGPSVDHVLVRGADASPTVRWPRERRLVGGELLSDHAPVERTLA
jgi:endonuclease/exonuclease/phosphatase family metal-dependent hydrolase